MWRWNFAAGAASETAVAGLLGVLPSTEGQTASAVAPEQESESEPEPESEPGIVENYHADAINTSAIGKSEDAGLSRKSLPPGDISHSLGDARTLQS